MGLKWLKSDIKYQEKCSIFFSNISQTRFRSKKKDKEEYAWGAPEFKVYPSGIDFGLCPLKYLTGKMIPSVIDNRKGMYRVARGKAIHGEYQKDFLESDKLYPKPNTETMTERIKQKLEDEWPEVPFHDLEENACIRDEAGNVLVTGLSGSVDAVIDWLGPVPVEIKSTSIFIEKWSKHVEDNLPDTKHICQLATYMVMMNRLGYYDKPITRGILAYVNAMYEPEDQKSEVEFVIHLDKPHPKLVDKGFSGTVRELIEDLLFKGIAPERKRFIENYLQEEKEELVCMYSNCKSHSGQRRTKIRASN